MISIYGKVPTARDFVRYNAGEFQKAEFDHWFQQGIEVLHTEQTSLPNEPIHFSIQSAKRTRFIGVFIGSQDGVGRKFPLIISASLPPQKGNDLSSVPLQHASFFTAAASSLMEIARDGLSATPPQIQDLEYLLQELPPSPSIQELLQQSSIAELKVSIGDLKEGGGYALNTLTVACEQARTHPATDAAHTITLECPAPSNALRTFWLELIQRQIGTPKVLPSFFWTATTLLVALGPPPPLLLGYLANPNHKGSHFWPLRTRNTHANEAAVQALTKDQADALSSNPASLFKLLAASPAHNLPRPAF